MPLNGLKLIATAFSPEQFPALENPEVVIVGRSNVGKSLMANRMAGTSPRLARQQGARVSSKPGCTRSVNFYELWKGVTLVDLPGYGYAKLSADQRRDLGCLVDSYLGGRTNIVMILHVADARLPLQKSDWQMLDWSRHFGYFHVLALNKCDKLSRPVIDRRQHEIRQALKKADLNVTLVPVSAATGMGIQELVQILRNSVSYSIKG